MSPHARRDPASLTECFEPPLRTYARLPKRVVQSLYWALIARSPVHFLASDMRHHYGWTRALLTAGATVAGLTFAIRLVLTGLFATFVSPSLPFVVVFNVCLTLLLGRLLLGYLDTKPRTRRRVVSAPTWWVRGPNRPNRPKQ